MMIDEIKRLIQNGEKIDVEFKESKHSLTKDVFDTVCSFNNRNGGHIILGINDKRDIVGVSKDKVDKVIKEFTTAINNPQKIYPPLYLLPEIFEINGKQIIYIRVPEGFQVCRHNGKIWDRSYEGDINITDNAELVYKLYARKQGSYFVNKVYPNLDVDFLDFSVIERVKKMAVERNKNHIWGNMSNEDVLRSANLILTDSETNREGITLAAILLFGIDTEKILVENSNLSHGIGILDLNKFEPFSKNPSISKVFREIGFADELGSGMRNTNKYTQLYTDQKPVFEEGNIFKTIIPLKKIATRKVGRNNVVHNVVHNVAHDVAHDVVHDKLDLVEFIKEKVRSNNKITRKSMADEVGVSVKTIERIIKLIENLKYVGTGSNGHWELNE